MDSNGVDFKIDCFFFKKNKEINWEEVTQEQKSFPDFRRRRKKSIQEFVQIGFKLRLGGISILGLQAVPRFVPGSV